MGIDAESRKLEPNYLPLIELHEKGNLGWDIHIVDSIPVGCVVKKKEKRSLLPLKLDSDHLVTKYCYYSKDTKTRDLSALAPCHVGA